MRTKDRILKTLLSRLGKWTIVEHLARDAGCDKEDVLLLVEELVEEGIPIVSYLHCYKIAESKFDLKIGGYDA